MAWAASEVHWSAVTVIGLAIAMGVDLLRVEVRQYSSDHKTAVSLDILAVFLVYGLVGPAWATIAALLNSAVNGLLARVSVYKVVYNAGVAMLAAFSAGLVMKLLPLPWLLAAPFAAGAYWVVNTGCIALVLSVVSGRPVFGLWKENYSWMALQQLALAIAGLVLGAVISSYGWAALLVALPLPMLRFTYVLYAKATQRHTQELEELSTELITTLAAVVDARDAYTFGHSSQVSRYSVVIAEQMGYSPEALKQLQRSALLHDIGKVGIPEKILFKPGRLTPEEYELMKRHTTIGHDIIKRIRPLQDAAIVALHHHERWNGSGYPDGLKGVQTNLDSRIVGVADTLETLISDRPYRRGCTLEEALAEIDRCCGTLFDPEVVAALHRVVKLKGAGFFVNSALFVAGGGSHVLQWTPADREERVAAAKQ
jgi:HD-GYP domain-containing protein (c-di-GMP phosphodiesterase class II)